MGRVISFDSNGGSAVDSMSQSFASAITAPASPTREGYYFAGWFPALPVNMPVNGAAVSALWTRAVFDTETLEIQEVQGLNGAVNTDADVAAGFDVDVVLEVELLDNDAVPSEDKKFIEDKIASEAPGVNSVNIRVMPGVNRR